MESDPRRFAPTAICVAAQSGLSACQPVVNRVNFVNLTFSDLRLPDWRGGIPPHYWCLLKGPINGWLSRAIYARAGAAAFLTRIAHW